MIRVVLVDDQAIVRAGFRVILGIANDIEVVGEASNGHDALEVVRQTRPHVVCMDVRMPRGDGIEATAAILATVDPPPAVLVITTFDLDEYVFGALEAGASGFLLKDTEPDDLIAAIRQLARGDGVIDHLVTQRVIAEFARRSGTGQALPPGLLTAREEDIVRLLAEGRSNSEIADALYIETSTVKSHLTRAMVKIGARDRVQVVVWAHRHGLSPA